MRTIFENFLNEEAKISDLKVGTKVILRGYKMRNFLDAANGCHINLEDKIATVKSVEKERDRWGQGVTYITFELDTPVTQKIDLFTASGKKVDIKMDVTTTEIKTDRTFFQDFEVIQGDYEDFIKKLSSGEISKFQATKEFLTVLRNIKFNKVGEYFDSSFFDVISGKTDMVSFIPSKKIESTKILKGVEALDKLTAKGKNPPKSDKPVDPEKFRQETRVGRILRKLNPTLKDQEIEDYVAKFRAEVEALFSKPDIQVVTGKDISFWYNEKNYQKGGGTLNNSCMRGSGAQSQVKFYDQHPDKVALAIYVKGDKLWGRALIWRLDDGRVYMDRIYSVKAEAAVQLEKYARHFNMLSRKDGGKGKMTVTLPKTKGSNFPYFDTFNYIYQNDKKQLVLANQQIAGLKGYNYY